MYVRIVRPYTFFPRPIQYPDGMYYVAFKDVGGVKYHMVTARWQNGELTTNGERLGRVCFLVEFRVEVLSVFCGFRLTIWQAYNLEGV